MSEVAAGQVITVVGVGMLTYAWLFDMLKGLRDAIRFAITTHRMRAADELLEGAAAERFDPELDAREREHRAELEEFDRELARERQKRLGGTVTRDAWAWQCNMCGAFISMDRAVCDCGHRRPKAGRAYGLGGKHDPETLANIARAFKLALMPGDELRYTDTTPAPIESGYLRATRRNRAGVFVRDGTVDVDAIREALERQAELARRVREKIEREGIADF